MLSVLIPNSLAAAIKASAKNPDFEFKAGGTDVVDRVRHRAAAPRGVIPLSRLDGLDAIAVADGSVRIGSLVALEDIATHPTVRERLGVLSQAALTTATPQIRSMATVGGALCQRPRCAYFRDEHFQCAKKGGTSCLAREGDHADHAIFNSQACMAPHASTIGAALLALDATLQVRITADRVEPWNMDRFFAIDFDHAARENALPKGAVIESVEVPLPAASRHRAAAAAASAGILSGRFSSQIYLRAAKRHLADWASVEAAVVIETSAGTISSVRIVLGGVDRVPRRVRAAEKILLGAQASPSLIARAGKAAVLGASPAKLNAWKIGLVQSTTIAALEEALT